MTSRGVRGLSCKWVLHLLILLACSALHAQSQGTVTYVYTDPQGTPLAETDANGNITATFDYTPYGTYAPQGTSTPGPTPNGPGYTGHVNDPETNLVYMQARYYDPATGRFLSVDPVAPTPGNTFNFNRSAYANNNPIDNIDPNGRETGAGYGNGEYGVYSHTTSPEEIRFSDQVDDGLDHLLQPLVAEVPEFEGVGTLLSEVREASTVEVTVAATDLSDVPHSSITAPYTRPNNATTVAQRAAQQGKPCVSCGKTADKMVADHKTPLVQEYYTTGTVDMKKATSNQAVQPQCPTCSAQQGGKLSQYGKQMKKVVQQRSQQQQSTGT
jgi:RHS repeat-associated protein